jgi:prepilin-type N-terminal cleavage/methylation domain-containing protein
MEEEEGELPVLKKIIFRTFLFGGLTMKKGFTLVELLTVVIIIGILVTMATPQYTKLVNRARWTECVWLAGAIRTGQVLYHTEHGVYRVGNLTDLNTVGLPPQDARLFSFSIAQPNMIYGVYEGYDNVPLDNFLNTTQPFFYVNLTANTTGYDNGAPYRME